METTKLKKFAQHARRSLIAQVSAKLKLVLAEGSPARRENEAAVDHLEKEIARTSKDQVIERVAYTWFNRFCALRFMDLNRYTGIGVVSPANGQTQPEILAEAKMGHIDESMVQEKIRQRVFALLGGTIPSRDPQGEAYRLLLVSACNAWSRSMPFLFQRIADYTELLLPDDLLSDNSILVHTREAMGGEEVGSGKWGVGRGGEEVGSGKWGVGSVGGEGGIGDVEIIGWLYQFYISEKKDEVFEGLKKNKKITPENIPAATQLFTPHWIVRYLVENSLGRLWMLNRPNSRLIERMDYYIEEVGSVKCEVGGEVGSGKYEVGSNGAQKTSHSPLSTSHLRISSPEEIRLCDPACGSGHMLVYAFDLLYAIYEEEGYEPKDIPAKILTHNLYGIEIDERAGELAAFALTMKARQYDKRFLSRATTSGKTILPNICVLQNVQLQGDELKKYMDFVGRDLFTPKLITTLHQFEEADNFGSLIRPEATDVQGVLGKLETKDVSRDAFLHLTHEKVLRALRQADYLSPKYHVVVANPPYMGSGSMNVTLKKFASSFYPETKNDLYAMFIQRCLQFPLEGCYLSMVSMHSWMFLSRFQKMRLEIIQNNTILTLIHLGAKAFDSIGGEVVSTAAFTIKTSYNPDFCATYFRLVDYQDSNSKNLALLSRSNVFVTATKDLEKVPGIPISYWLSPAFRAHFVNSETLDSKVETAVGLFTCNNELFLRNWFEISINKIGFGYANRSEAKASRKKFFPIQKGGGFRRWYGLNYLVVQYSDDGKDVREYRKKAGQSWSLPGENYYFRSGITWSGLTTDANSFRWCDKGSIFESNKGQMLFSCYTLRFLGYLNSVVCAKYIACINPTLSVQSNEIKRLPFVESFDTRKSEIIVKNLIDIGKLGWNSYEISRDFTILPTLNPDFHLPTLKATYSNLRTNWHEITLEMQRLEEENNRIFIEAYGLQDELTPEVPLKEITLTCNPYYRYGVEECEVGSEKWEEMEGRLLADTMKEFISYSVGCMFGRYSLDMPGLVLANQGESIEDYYRKIEEYRANGRKELSGADCLAEGDGSDGTGVSGNQAVSERGIVRTYQSDTQSGSINSVQHSRGASQTIDRGVQELSVDSPGIQGGGRDANDDRSAVGLSSTTECRANPKLGPGNQTNDPLPDSQASLTSHSPLPTPHFSSPHSPLPTPHFSFPPDVDNVIPILDGDWFPDDVTERFRKFLRVTFGEEHYEENLEFIEKAIGKDIRKYFLKDFYADHVRRYKKRPIYWLFTSPKGSFNALIYMHRYRPDTVSVVLNDYLREFRTKLQSRLEHLKQVEASADASKAEKTRAIKEIEALKKTIDELDTYERDTLYPLATRQIQIDLDDGVKVNYPKFGAALKKIPGLEAKED